MQKYWSSVTFGSGGSDGMDVVGVGSFDAFLMTETNETTNRIMTATIMIASMLFYVFEDLRHLGFHFIDFVNRLTEFGMQHFVFSNLF